MFSVGFTGSVLFGSIEHTQNSTISRDGYVINNVISKDSLRDALRISVGAFLTGAASLKTRNEIFIEDQHTYYSYRYNGYTYYTAQTDTIANDTIQSSKVKIPKGFGIGVSVEIAEQLTINADYHSQAWGGFKLPNDANTANVRDSKYFGFGMQYVNAKYSSKYYRTINYRIGAYTQQTYYQIDGHGIDDKGITFGLGFPVRQGQLRLNISCQLGKRGTSAHNLYEEKYFLVHFNATLHDIWFLKRKFQ